MTTIIFVRHGESQANVHIHNDPNDPDLSQKICALGDPELSHKGFTQATAVGNYLNKKLDCDYYEQKVRVLTSLYTRTIQTSQPFYDTAKGKSIIEMYEHTDMLCEYTKPMHQLTDEHKSKGLRHHETWKDFTDQVEDFVNLLETMCQVNQSPIVVFGHSLFISVLVSYLGSCKKMIPEKHELTFRFPNCSITTFNYSQGSWKIFNVGSIAHLLPPHVTGVECPFGTVL